MTEGKIMASEQVNYIKSSEQEYVSIAPNAISLPLGRILLIRKNYSYCAIKFVEYRPGKTVDEEYAIYESYFQNDNTGNFTNKNVQITKAKLSFPKSYGIGRFAFTFGKNIDVRCGKNKFQWSGNSWVYFYSSDHTPGDYGFELAPTIWTDISQVNVIAPQIRWYKYDSNRKDINIPIDRLWTDIKKD